MKKTLYKLELETKLEQKISTIYYDNFITLLFKPTQIGLITAGFIDDAIATRTPAFWEHIGHAPANLHIPEIKGLIYQSWQKYHILSPWF